jgi:hypothetical protein
MAKLGNWRWYCGSDSDDDEMLDSGTREKAIEDGARNFGPDAFYIVEARMRIADENAMAAGRLDAAPFAETRNGEWIGSAGGQP